jgi:hypothetical protein
MGWGLSLVAVTAAGASGWPYAFVALAADAVRAADSERAVILLREGDTPVGGGGLPVAGLGLPATDARGEVGVTGYLDDAGTLEPFVWRGGRVVFLAGDTGLTGASPALGIGDAGRFVFQSNLGEADVIWSQEGQVVREGDPAPGFPAGTVLEISRRPSMLPDGRAYWVSEFRDGPGGRGEGRVLYRSPGASPATVEVVLRSDDLVAGLPLARPRGLDWAYDLSSDGAHHVHVVQLVTGSTADDDAVALDGALAAREGEPTSDGDRWARFLQVAADSSGHTLIGGETDGPAEEDVVVAYDGRVVARERMAGAGFRIEPQANILALALDDRGRAAHLWSVGGFGGELLLFACDAANLAESVVLAHTPQPLEVDADPGADVVLHAFADVGHGPALSLDDGKRLWVEAEITAVAPAPASERRDAVVGLRLPPCPMGG